MSSYTQQKNISAMNDLFFFGDNGDVKAAVEFLLKKLPTKVAETIYQDCIVIVINDTLDGYYIPAELVTGKSIIVLNYELFRSKYNKFITTFFHEVAHHWLKHAVLFGRDSQREKIQEKEAEELVSQWLLRNGD
ncbi:MAG: hypothetical protein CVV44_09920 [Spirochaetae bacterium HGW-Spirochaetae-1]|jgi:hypothetical protein|nr:MAG: hypothetical protein CVV44_09920 [Spirochaetae bacterium HGW-Spirochaetae-1]